MNMTLNNLKTCIDYILVCCIDIYHIINFSIEQLSRSNINDEQVAIVNN